MPLRFKGLTVVRNVWLFTVLVFFDILEFEVNIVIVFTDDHLVSENFPIKLTRSWPLETELRSAWKHSEAAYLGQGLTDSVV